jgi:capsular polysaccharide transport system ATP-binding protein
MLPDCLVEFRNVTKSYRIRGGSKPIVRDLTLILPSNQNVAVIGRNGSGKSTLLRMISGTLPPERGRILRHGRISWPMGFSGGLHAALTGRQNARFIARVYGTDTDYMVDYVTQFSELGSFLDMPINTYSTGMKARLAFGISLAAKCDCYLIDEITEVGDAVFKEKCRVAFREQMKGAQLIVVSHSEATLKSLCTSGLLLIDGVAHYFESLEEALQVYRHSLVR